MKIDIDLNELSLEELEQFLGLAKKSKKKGFQIIKEPKIEEKVGQKVIVVQPKKRRKGRVFDKEFWAERFKEILRLINSGVSKTDAMRQVNGYVLQGKVKKRFEKFLRKGIDGRSIFMNFINKRAKKYTAQGYPIDEARKLATEDYRKERDGVAKEKVQKKKKGEYMIKSKPYSPLTPEEVRLRLASQMAKPKVVLSFPKFDTVQEVYHPILQSVVRNMLEIDGTRITYNSEGLLLDIGKDDWKEFLSEFFTNSNDISLFFKVPNNFKIKYDEVVYMK